MNVHERIYWNHQMALADEYEARYAPKIKDRKRGERRHHRQRMIARMGRIIRHNWWHPEGEDLEATIAELAPRWADNRKRCSCPMCGNPRRWYGTPTRQEMRAMD